MKKLFPALVYLLEKLKLFTNDNDNKENENNIEVTGLILTSYVYLAKQNK